MEMCNIRLGITQQIIQRVSDSARVNESTRATNPIYKSLLFKRIRRQNSNARLINATGISSGSKVENLVSLRREQPPRLKVNTLRPTLQCVVIINLQNPHSLAPKAT